MPCHGWSLLFWWSAIAVRQLILVSLQTQSWAFNTLVRKRKEGKDMMCGQVWCPILGVCALHLTHPSAHTQQWDMKKHTHTHTLWTPPLSSGLPMLRHPGSSWGFGALLKGLTSVVVLRVERVLGIHSPPHTYNPCWTWDSNLQPSGYKSIIPRLPQVRSWKCTCTIIDYECFVNAERDDSIDDGDDT